MSRLVIITRHAQSKFNIEMSSFFSKNFPERSITLLCIKQGRGLDDSIYPDIDNIKILDCSGGASWILRLREECKSATHIAFSSMFLPVKVMFFLFWKRAWQKRIWIVWGADLYGKRNAISLAINKALVRKFINFVALSIPEDERKLRERYQCSAPEIVDFWFPSRSDSVTEAAADLLKIVPQSINADKIFLVGNSAAVTNNHIEVLHLIRSLPTTDYRILLILSYGDKIYANNVKRVASDLFGARAICIEEMLSFEDYIKLLKKVDVAFLAHNRQQAGHTAMILAALGKVVYLKESNSIMRFLSNRGVVIFNLDHISSSGRIRSELSEDEKISNSRISLYLLSNLHAKSRFESFFQAIDFS